MIILSYSLYNGLKCTWRAIRFRNEQYAADKIHEKSRHTAYFGSQLKNIHETEKGLNIHTRITRSFSAVLCKVFHFRKYCTNFLQKWYWTACTKNLQTHFGTAQVHVLLHCVDHCIQNLIQTTLSSFQNKTCSWTFRYVISCS